VDRTTNGLRGVSLRVVIAACDARPRRQRHCGSYYTITLAGLYGYGRPAESVTTTGRALDDRTTGDGACAGGWNGTRIGPGLRPPR